MIETKWDDKNFWKQLPADAGVYFFCDEKGVPLYIGKAIDIRTRIKQHYTDTINPKERQIIKNSRLIKWEVTNSEFDALILEANLVRKLLPKYNAELKDDKSPIYIVFTKGEFKKIRLVRKRDLTGDEAFIFGPMDSAYHTRYLLRHLRRIIPFCTEKRITKKPCFYSQVGLCNPCPNAITQVKDKTLYNQMKEEYQRNIRRLMSIFKGDGRRLVKILEKEMEAYSEKEDFEMAAYLRDKIAYLERLFTDSITIDEHLDEANFTEFLREKENKELQDILNLKQLGRVECYDVSNMGFQDATASMVVFEQGAPIKDEYRRFKIKKKRRFDPEMLLEVLERRLTHKEWMRPDLLIIDGGTPQLLKIYPALTSKYKDLPEIIGIAKHPDRILIARSLTYLELPSDSLALHYVQRIRDEAHRFAKKYHLLLRRKSFVFN